MKAVKLTPLLKHHAIRHPFRVDVDDLLIDIADATPVSVWLGYQATESDIPIESPDLPGTLASGPFNLRGPWIEVAPKIREIRPTTPGIYTVFVEAWVNIAIEHPVPPVYRRMVYSGVPVHVG